MADLEWCKKQGKGIKLIEPNDNLAEDYLKSAEETLSILRDIENKSNIWLATTKYYCEYFTVYALLMKIGIKSEIHDCTIEVCRLLEEEKILPQGTFKTLKKDKQLRIDNQYYLKNRKVSLNVDEIINFVLSIKKIINSLTLDEIKDIRKKLFGD